MRFFHRKAGNAVRCMVVAFFLAIMAGGLSGCGTDLLGFYFGDLFKKNDPAEKAPQQLALEGIEKLKKKKYADAIEDFKQLKERYPYSKFAILAEIKLADAYYGKKQYAEAAVAYEEFVRLHPRNEIIPYSLYQIGMCHFKSFNGIDREQEETRLAQDAFQRLAQAYPDSEYAAKAKKQILECRKRVAAHAFYVAQFYYRRGEYLSVKQRLEALKETYPDAVKELKYEKDIEKMLTVANREVEKGEKKPSIWSRIGM